MNTDLVEAIHAGKPWEDSFEPLLKTFGFAEPKPAWTNLLTLSGQAGFSKLYPGFFSDLLDSVQHSYNADIALHNFERFAKKIIDKDYLYSLCSGSRDLLNALILLFSGSQVLTDTLIRDPSHFDWLKHPETLNKRKSRDVLMRDYFEFAEEKYLSEKTPSLLRRFKQREYIRLGLRDLMGKSTMAETVEDLSHLADMCLQVAYEFADKQCKARYGTPFYEDPDGNEKEAEFAVLGMGKLGGMELNYSSDIDLIYIYTSSRGETRPLSPGSGMQVSTHEYFTKLALLLTKTINEITPEGNVFRVDLNLRPEGQSGEIVNSLSSCEVYYQSWGRPWERQALLKARVSAGSETLGKEFFKMLEPFIHRRSLDFSAIEEIKSMKEKINQSLKGKKGKAHIKLGFGGIREIEFIVQAYQLLFSGRDKALRVANTLTVLKRLHKCGFLHQEDYKNLREAYIFLRNLENRVQISYGLQTHVMPDDEAQQAVLARKMGIQGDSPRELAEGLLKEYDRHTQFVGNLFAGLFAEEKKKEAEDIATRELGRSIIGEEQFNEDLLSGIPFEDPGRAFRFLSSLKRGGEFSVTSSKTVQDFFSILPAILELCRRVPKPNSAVENLVRFVEASRARETFLGLFQSNEKFLELLLILFGSSDFLSEILIKHPDLVDGLMDLEAIYRFKPPARLAEELTRDLQNCADLRAKKINLRRFKQGEELRIGVRYLIHEADLVGTLSDLSDLADVFLRSSFDIACEEMQTRSTSGSPLPADFAIIGMGKLGGQELNFASDLDVLLVYDEPDPQNTTLPKEEVAAHYSRLSQLIYQITSEMTPAGIAYKIDTDLRPEGASGVLVLSVQGYEDYFQSRARIWEQQALTRARFVAGDPGVGEKFMQVAHAFAYRKKLDYGSLIEISRLRERMEKELAQEATKGKNVKLGFGGLADIEFSVQVLQLMHGHRYPRLRFTNTLNVLQVLAESGLMDIALVEQVREDYLFLRNLECALRIINRQSSNHLPTDEASLAALAKLLGDESETPAERAANLLRDYEKKTGRVRTFYRKQVDTLLRTAL